jgi:hypothetical protein
MRAAGLSAAVLALATVTPAACTQQPAPAPSRSGSTPRAAGHTDRAIGSRQATITRPPVPRRTSPPVESPVPCPNGAVGVSAARGGALPGEEVALLVFTNHGASACTLTGFPGVELLAHNVVIGRPATRSSMAVHTLRLARGATATARLVDDSRCNAPLSDTVGVYVPNQTVQLHAALELRGCALTIDPVRS